MRSAGLREDARSRKCRGSHGRTGAFEVASGSSGRPVHRLGRVAVRWPRRPGRTWAQSVEW
eukprot:6558967-Pyramimonas_sp.AAC.1